MPADIGILSCGAANNAKLLLASAGDDIPAASPTAPTRSGNDMFHNSQALLALSKEENPTVFQKTLRVDDFSLSGPDHAYPANGLRVGDVVPARMGADVPAAQATVA